jgi:hypothetical protein
MRIPINSNRDHHCERGEASSGNSPLTNWIASLR